MAHRSLRVAAAHVALDLVDTAQLVTAAHDALDDGVYSYSLGELATFKGTYRQDYLQLFMAALQELGECVPDLTDAVMTLLEQHCVSLAEGAAAPGDVLNQLYSIERDLRYSSRVKVPQEALTALQPFINLYYAVDEYHSYREYAQAYSGPLYAVPGPDEFYANAVSLAAGFCRDRWGSVMNPAWLTSTVVILAQGISADRAFDRLPILADALEEAWCDNTGILDHCRSGGPHVRGCWVVDLILEKR
jgi:hypothetical protein